MPSFPLSPRASRSLAVAGSCLLGLWILAVGCGTPRQTVSVSERPTASADTVVASVDTLSARVDVPAGYDTVQVGAFDRGKLWPPNRLPVQHFRTTYGLTPDSAWRAKAQRAALRFGDGCSASFVSGRGLVLTNHHCAREAIGRLSRSGEALLETGFYADSLGQERRVPDLHVDQLVEIRDVTGRVLKKGTSRETRAETRQQRVQRIEDVMTEKAQQTNPQLRVEVVSLYAGAQYAAYTYRRYEDVRLVMAPELQAGYFGGESDNFTYPRFSFDVAFFRVYADDDTPLRPDHHFSWALDGAAPGDPVFAVGNPGSTSRHDMVSQLEYKRDYQLPDRLAAFRARRGLLASYIANNPETATEYNLRNPLFSVANTIKSLEGQLRGLQDPYLLARRGTALRTLRDTIAKVDSLQRYVRTIGEVKRLQQSKRILADKQAAFLTFANLELGARIFTRAVHAYYYDFLRTRGASAERVESIRTDAESITDWPAELEQSFLTTQLRELRSAYGPNHPTMQRLLGEQSPEALASQLVEESALTDSTRFVKLLDEGYLKSDDASVPVIEALAPLFLNVSRQMEDIRRTEETLNGRLSTARQAIYGDRVPPDASFTLRISDGVVKGYAFNGTRAPSHTSFYGMYDRYHAHGADDWALPDRWISPPDSFALGTPLNVASTVDISGGSSGSPLLNADLELVGVVFDSNMEGLPNEYLYRDEAARAVAVDVRGIVEALRNLYGADRLVSEILTHAADPAVPSAAATDQDAESSRRR